MFAHGRFCPFAPRRRYLTRIVAWFRRADGYEIAFLPWDRVAI